jgi:hypothetical protein
MGAAVRAEPGQESWVAGGDYLSIATLRQLSLCPRFVSIRFLIDPRENRRPHESFSSLLVESP